jgi:HSP20 family protein
MAKTDVLDPPTTQQTNETSTPSGTPGTRQESRQGSSPGGGLTRQGQTSGGLSRRGTFDPWLGGPLSMMRQMAEEMDRVFGDFFDGGFGALGRSRQGLQPRGFGGGLGPAGRGMWTPQIEVFERGNQLVVRADLPGIKRDDLQVEVQDGALILQGERRSEHEENREGLYRSERSYGSFYRAIPLPEGVNPDDVHGNFQNGVLEVTMPAPKPSSRGRRVELQEGPAGTAGGASQGGASSGK